MSVALALGLGFFVLTSVGGVLSVGLVSGYRNTVDLLRQKAELLTTSESSQLRRFLGAAEDQLDYADTMIRAGEVEPGSDEDFTSLLLGALAATPQIIAIYFIDSDYILTGAERLEDETSPLFAQVRNDDDLVEIVDQARERSEPWWSGLLWRVEYEQALMPYAFPLFDGEEFRGVMVALVSVTLLSEFVSDLEYEFGANAFILYGRDQVLAHPLLAFGYVGLSRQRLLPRRDRFSDPVLQAMWNERPLGPLEARVLEGPGIHAVKVGQSDYVFLHKAIEGYGEEPLLIGTYFAASDMLTEVLRFKWAVVFCGLISLASALVAAYIGRQIAQPVRRLAEGSNKIHHLDLDSVEDIPESFFRELNDAAASFNLMLEGLRWFERYVPKNLVRRLIKRYGDPSIETSFHEVVILFTDIPDFTGLSEGMSAPEMAAFLNDHFSLIASCIEAEGGSVHKFIGDGVMAVWGAPDPYEDMADRACRAALAIREKLERYNRSWAEAGDRNVGLRIGLHQGRVVVGNIGSPMRIDYTVVGDPVNVAVRLEELGKTVGGGDQTVVILASKALCDELRGDYPMTALGSHSLRGRREEVEVMRL